MVRAVFLPAATCKASRIDTCWVDVHGKKQGTTKESNILMKISDWSLPLVAGDLLFKFCLLH